MPQREPYSPALFVGREKELEQLAEWAMTPIVTRRLKSIAAPPGQGKSWLLAAFKERLLGRPDLFILPIPSLQLTSREKIVAWLPTMVKEAQKFCPQVLTNVQNNSLEIIPQLATDLNENCSPQPCCILFIDGLDESFRQEQIELEKHLLEPFWSFSNVRMIITFRDESGLIRPMLRRGEERIVLPPFSPDEGRQQLAKREKLQLSQTDLLNLVNPYSLKIPGLNTILVKRIKENEQANRQPLLANDLRVCRHELVGKEKLKRRPQSLETLENDLKKIVEHNDTWNLETFAELCGYNLYNAHNHIESLMALSIVTHTRRQRYKVVDGLRELLRAENRLIKEEGLAPSDTTTD